MTFESIVERLNDWRSVLDAWPVLIVLTLATAGIVWIAVRLPLGRRLRAVQGRLEQSDRQLDEAKEKLAAETRALAAERDRGRDAEASIVSLREQLASAHRELAQSKPVEAPLRASSGRRRYEDLFGDGPAVDGPLDRRETERLTTALDEVSRFLTSRMGPSGIAGASGSAWWAYVARKGVPHAVELLTSYRKEAIAFANGLEEIVGRQPDLEFRLRRIVGDTGLVAGLLNVTGGCIRSMERLDDGETYKPAVLEMALGSPFQNVVRAQAAVDEWTRLLVERRLPAVREELAGRSRDEKAPSESARS